MKKLDKKIALVLGSALLVVGLIAVPAFAKNDPSDTATNTTIPQNYSDMMNSNTQMNSPAMQNVYNSSAMQGAMNSGDFSQMQDAMNSSEVKAQLGEDFVNQMNEVMANPSMQSMHQAGSGNGMMNSNSGSGMMY